MTDGILVEVSFGLGNAIMKTPMLIALRRLYPDTIINVWCCHTVGQETLNGLREHWYQPKPLFNIWGRKDYPSGHTMAIITEPRDDTFRKSAVAQKYIEHSKKELELFENRHEVEVNMDLVRRLGYKGATPQTRVFIPKETQQEIDKILLQYQFSKYKAVIAIHNGSLNTDYWSFKRWNEKYVEELVNRLDKENILPIIVGTKEDTGASTNTLDFRNKFSIKETAALLSRCSLMISTDSGPSHLADAVGIPTIVLFGPTYPSKNVPYNYGQHIASDIVCRPCYWTGRMKKCVQKYDRAPCMEKISVDMVLEKVKSLILRRV